jgi:hypothetical protein
VVDPRVPQHLKKKCIFIHGPCHFLGRKQLLSWPYASIRQTGSLHQFSAINYAVKLFPLCNPKLLMRVQQKFNIHLLLFLSSLRMQLDAYAG